MTECRKTAGWVTLVCLSSSEVPSNMILEMENPSWSSARSNNSFATDECSYRFLPIPVNCAPCPGNTYAFIVIFLAKFEKLNLKNYFDFDSLSFSHILERKR